MICASWLVILSGIAAVFAILRRKSYPRNAADKKDIISQLPDDILVSIITRMPLKFAIRTSILSKRWRNLYKFVSNINLSCDDLLWRYPPSPPHDSYSEVIICRLERFLRMYSGSKIRSFNLSCCLTKSYTDRLEQCIYFLGKLGIEKLVLSYSCCFRPSLLSFSYHLLSEVPSLKHFWLRSGSLQPNLKSQCNSLQTLRLSSVTLLPGSLECILSNCLRLHSLLIGRCNCPSKLCFRGPNLPLKSLIIKTCIGAEEIEFCASNLTTFEFQNPDVVNFIFDHVPRLQTVYLSLAEETVKKNLMSYVFGKLAKDLRHLKSLTFDTRGDFYQESRRLMRMGIETFSSLRRLVLSVCCTPKTNLLELTPFLQSCPLLQEFHLDTLYLKYDGPQPRKPVVFHSELKKVEISGFSGTENETEFALYILKSAVSLEQMLIRRWVNNYMGQGRWMRARKDPWSEETHKMIQKQLQGQALSKTAQVIIQLTQCASPPQLYCDEHWLGEFPK